MSPPNGAPPGNAKNEYLQVPTSSQDDTKCSPEETQPVESDFIQEDEAEVVVPPDGGWGWMVVFASFMCNLIVDGIIFSFGSFLTPISKEFGVSEARVALVGSLMSGFYLIAGPFASAVANRYGFRLVAIGGSLLGAAAFALANFATNVDYLCIVFGVLGGERSHFIVYVTECYQHEVNANSMITIILIGTKRQSGLQ
jgi:MCP family monocarboxylic acid transporter-like MFS transporter 14